MEEYESSVSAEVCASRKVSKNRHAMEDILYLLMGEASVANVVVMIFALLFFGATPVAMLLLFGAYSGGMRWLITLGLVAVMGSVAVYLMKRGVEKSRTRDLPEPPRTEFRGELTGLTETLERAATGYAYSQQILRERLCEAIIEKLGTARDLGTEEMVAMLESGDTRFVGDEVLARFLLENRRGTGGWEDDKTRAKGKSAERGKKFMLEFDAILKLAEAMV